MLPFYTPHCICMPIVCTHYDMVCGKCYNVCCTHCLQQCMHCSMDVRYVHVTLVFLATLMQLQIIDLPVLGSQCLNDNYQALVASLAWIHQHVESFTTLLSKKKHPIILNNKSMRNTKPVYIPADLWYSCVFSGLQKILIIILKNNNNKPIAQISVLMIVVRKTAVFILLN